MRINCCDFCDAVVNTYLRYMVGRNSCTFSTHHIFGNIEDKMTRVSLQCSENLCDEK